MSILSLDGRSIIFKTFALLSPISWSVHSEFSRLAHEFHGEECFPGEQGYHMSWICSIFRRYISQNTLNNWKSLWTILSSQKSRRQNHVKAAASS
jgi:hypothetical protein